MPRVNKPTHPTACGRNQAVVDRVLAAVLVAAGLLSIYLVAAVVAPRAGSGIPVAVWVVMAAQVAVSTTLLRRRHAPVRVAGLITATALVVETAAAVLVPAHAIGAFVALDLWVAFALSMVADVLVTSSASRREAQALWALIVLVTLVAVRPWAFAPDGLLHTLVPALIGMYFGARRRLVQALRDRADRAEREQHLRAEQARHEERTRLAAEMHDVVSHRVSLMVLQAGALRVTASDEATRETAEDLRATGCQALEELRDLVGVLRSAADEQGDTGSAGSPGTGIPDLAVLLAESESVGVPVDLVESGNAGPVSPLVARTGQRILQEALTNVRKHALGSRVRVEIRYLRESLHLTVTNSPPPPATADAALAATGSGSGLAGLEQRVGLVGGALRAGRTPEGGFEVEVSLPCYVRTADSVPAGAG